MSETSAIPVVLELVPVGSELRIRDIDLGARLGFDRPRKIRDLIARHGGALSKMGNLPTEEEIVGKGQKGIAFYLNRKQAIFITAKSETAEATDITIEIIERFDAYERGASPVMDPMKALNDPAAMRGLLLTYSEKVLALEATNAILAPKADALDRIATVSDGALGLIESAKALQVRPKDLTGSLSTNGWIYRRAGGTAWLGYQSRTSAGDMEHKITTVLRADGTEKMVEQVKITPRGLAKLAKLIPGRLAIAVQIAA